MQERNGAFVQRTSSWRSAHHKLPKREGDRIVARVLGRSQFNRITNTETALAIAVHEPGFCDLNCGRRDVCFRADRTQRRLAITSGFEPIQIFDMRPSNPDQHQKCRAKGAHNEISSLVYETIVFSRHRWRPARSA